jgi:hypothetical protein
MQKKLSLQNFQDGGKHGHPIEERKLAELNTCEPYTKELKILSHNVEVCVTTNSVVVNKEPKRVSS